MTFKCVIEEEGIKIMWENNRNCSGRNRNKDLETQEKTIKCNKNDNFKNRIRNSIFINEKYIESKLEL